MYSDKLNPELAATNLGRKFIVGLSGLLEKLQPKYLDKDRLAASFFHS